MNEDSGAPASGTGSREPSPAVSALAGFDPSRGETIDQFAKRAVAEARAAWMSQASDDVIGKLGPAYIAFGKICVIAALTMAMAEAKAAQRDMDGSRDSGGDGAGGSVHDGPGLQGIAQPGAAS